MAINKNHEFEELGGVKCAIVEKNAPKERVVFLKDLLEHNSFKVVVVPSPPPKPATPPKPAPATEADPQQPQPASPDKPGQAIEPQTIVPETFTIGVTNLAFNPTNAIFGRLLKTKDGHIVTQAYWYQKDPISHDDTPYYEQKI